MDKTLESLYQIIQKLVGLHRQLLDIIRLEKQALLDMNIKDVQECTYSKEVTLSGIHTAESERQKRISELSVQTKKPVEQLTLTQIIILVQGQNPKFAEQLRSSFNALTILVARIKESNLENSRLIDQALIHIRSMKTNALQEAEPKAATYGQNAQKVQAGAQSARLISGEA